MPRKKVLFLGATGKIGSDLLDEYKKHYKKYYDVIIGIHKHKKLKKSDKLIGFKTVKIDILNLKTLKKAMNGIDVVVNLAAISDAKAKFEDLLKPNIIGCYNVFEAARKAKCKKVIFASSVHAVKGYPLSYQVKPNNPTKPITLYGATKIFGESLCHIFSQFYSCIAIRIGAYTSNNEIENVCLTRKNYDYVITQKDLAQLIHKCIIARKIKFAILHGISNNKKKFLNLELTKKLVGYKPKDDAFEICNEIKKLNGK